MPRGHEHDLIYSLSIYVPFKFSLIKKIVVLCLDARLCSKEN